jgi:hypothetical protein
MPRTARPASVKQTDFISSLVLDRETEGLAPLTGVLLGDFLQGTELTSDEASSLISALLKAPRLPKAPKAAAAPAKCDVPAGRYALDRGEGVLDFVQVDRPTKGKWAGFVFTKRLLGAPGDFRQVRTSRDESARLLAEIAADAFRDEHTDEEDGEVTVQNLTGPGAAAVRFSRRFTCCAMCLSPLSDKVSRARGLGPICAKRV